MPGSGTSRIATLITGGAGLAGLGALFSVTGVLRGPILATVAGCLLGVAVLLRANDEAADTVLASTLCPLIAVFAVGAVLLSLLEAGGLWIVPSWSQGFASGDSGVVIQYLGVTITAGFVPFGTICTVRDGLGDGAIGHLGKSVFATLTVVGIGLAVLLAPRPSGFLESVSGATELSPLLDPVLAPQNLGIALVSFWILWLLVAWSAQAVVTSIPIVTLTARSRREHASELRDRIVGVLWRAIGVGLLVTVGSIVLIVSGNLDTVLRSIPGSRSVILAPDLRSTLGWIVGIFVVLDLAISVIESMTGRIVDALRSFLPSAVGGIVAVILAVIGAPFLRDVQSAVPAGASDPLTRLLDTLSPVGLTLGFVAVAILALLAGLTIITVARALGYVPSRAAGGAFVATGLVLGAVSIGATGGHPGIVFLTIGSAIVAWDASDRGVTTRSELRTTRTRIEVVHTVGSIGTAAVGGVFAWTLYSNLDAVAVPDGNLTSAIAAIFAALLLLNILKG